MDPSSRRYGVMLVVLLAGYVLSSDGSTVLQDAFAAALVVITAVGLSDPLIPRGLRLVGFAGCLVVVVVLVASFLGVDGEPLRGLGFVAAAVLVLVTVPIILLRIAQHDHVATSTVMGAVLAYTLVGGGFGLLYHGIDLMTDAAFFAQGSVRPDEYTYFAFVTLTTLGFGDLSPATALGQRLVVVETLVGQVYLVVLVARLVSLWGQPLPGRRSEQ